MKKLCYDIEANHYEFDKLRVIHCIAIGDIETNKVSLYVTEEEQKEAVEILNNAEVLIGHNLIRYDHKALQMFQPQFKPIKTHDTLIMSRLAKPKWRTHSLETWGKVLNFKKGDYAKEFKEKAGDQYVQGQEWFEYNDAMGDYCKRDVLVNMSVYRKLLPYVGKSFSWENLELEQFTTEMMEVQKNKIGTVISLVLEHGYQVQLEQTYDDAKDRLEDIHQLARNPVRPCSC